MKLTTTLEFVWNFMQFQSYLSALDRVTSKPVVNLERDVMFAIARTGKKIKGDIELLQEMQQKRVDELKPISTQKGNDLIPQEGKEEEFKVYNETFNKDWKATLKKVVELEIHGIKQSDIPKTAGLPEMFWGVLVDMTMEEEK